ncbi:hypothetical protein LTR27_004850 [Elasticomyces elasticus]|nr:hypothetical protein LTR27_004850 [Elasticomyces elasticus]
MDPKANLVQQHCALHLRSEAFEDFRGLVIVYIRDRELPHTADSRDDFTVGFLAVYGTKLWPKSDDHRKHLISDSESSRALVYHHQPMSRTRKETITGTQHVLYSSQVTTADSTAGTKLYSNEGLLQGGRGKASTQLPWVDLSAKTKQEWAEKAEKVMALLDAKRERNAREATLKSELGMLLSNYYLAMLGYQRGANVLGKPGSLVTRITAGVNGKGVPRNESASVRGKRIRPTTKIPVAIPTTPKEIHAALSLQPAMFEPFRALVIRHTLDMGLQLNTNACQEFTISFMRVYAHILWPRGKTTRQHLIEEGVGGPVYPYVSEQPPPNSNADGFNGFQAFRESYIPTITLSSPNIKPHQVEYVVQSHWHLLPAAVQGDWERKAYERFQIWEGQCIEHSRSVALSSRLGKLLSANFTALLDCEPFDMVHDTSDALLAKIWSLGAPEVDNPQLGYRPDTQQAVHEGSVAPAPVTNVASFWAKFEQGTV